MLNNIHDLLLTSIKQSKEEPYHEVLESITSTSDSYFDIDVNVSANLTIDFEFGITSNYEFNNGCIFGSYESAGGSNFLTYQVAFPSTTEIRLPNAISFANVSLGSSTTLTAGTRYNVTYKPGNVFFNETKISEYSGSFSLTSNKLRIFGRCSSDILQNSVKANVVFYCMKISNNGVLIYDLIPVLNNKMEPCLYDRVTKQFIMNKGTTDVTFKRWNKYDVDYIESTGTQYIDTGIKDIQNTVSTVKFKNVTLDGSQFTTILGAQDSAADTDYKVLIGYASGAGTNAYKYYIQTGGPNGYMYSNVVANTTDLFEITSSVTSGIGNNTIIINGDSYSRSYAITTTTVQSLYLFARNKAGSASNFAKIILYGLQIKKNDNLVRDLKPSVRTYNDGTNVATKAFMYDEVYNKAYDNAGTGSFKAYIEGVTVPYTLEKHSTMDTNGFYLSEDGTKTVSSDGTSCYTEAIQVKEGDIIEWTVTAEAFAANKRIHGYTTNADITTSQKGSWVEMLAKIVFNTTSDTTQTATFVVPSGVNYIRLSHANTRETQDSIVRIRTYEVGKAIKYPQNNGFTLDAPNSSNFILDLLTRATTTSSYYMLDTRNQTGSSTEEEFGIGGSQTGATVNWKCESESNLVKTNGTNWVRNSNYTYSHLLVGYKDGNTFKRTALFYDFNNQRISDIEIVTATRDIANNTKPLTVLHTTSSNWLQNGAEIHYFKYLQDGNDVWYDCIPVRNATVTSSVLLFDRVNNTSLPNTGTGTPTFVALD